MVEGMNFCDFCGAKLEPGKKICPACEKMQKEKKGGCGCGH